MVASIFKKSFYLVSSLLLICYMNNTWATNYTFIVDHYDTSPIMSHDCSIVDELSTNISNDNKVITLSGNYDVKIEEGSFQVQNFQGNNSILSPLGLHTVYAFAIYYDNAGNSSPHNIYIYDKKYTLLGIEFSAPRLRGVNPDLATFWSNFGVAYLMIQDPTSNGVCTVASSIQDLGSN